MECGRPTYKGAVRVSVVARLWSESRELEHISLARPKRDVILGSVELDLTRWPGQSR